MKVYLVMRHYDNGKSCPEDYIYEEVVVAVAATEAKAKEIIAEQPIPFCWQKKRLYNSNEPVDALKIIWCRPASENDEAAQMWWTVEEKEVIGAENINDKTKAKLNEILKELEIWEEFINYTSDPGSLDDEDFWNACAKMQQYINRE